MKKIYLLLVLFLCIYSKVFSCAWYDADREYYNLFMQEIIEDPRYYPFLVSLESAYYATSEKDIVANENIQEWQEYLGLTYEQTYYLVFTSKRTDLRDIVDGKSSQDSNLSFITSAFVSKHKQALLYLLYAKYLEPYMSIDSNSDWSYSENRKTVNDLDYDKVIRVLQRSWVAEKDKELKLRYGYQLVRFAHYSYKYDVALEYFDDYVESLNYKPAMYYHALAQKAGAERGLGSILDSNFNFLTVFSHSNNLKQMALTSIKLNRTPNYNDLLNRANTTEEKNDVYLLLGFLGFNNPLNEIPKIVKGSPDAIQAKVLMARAINLIERGANVYYDSSINFEQFEKTTLEIVLQMTSRQDVKERDFWNISASYLHYLNSDYKVAREFLNKIQSNSDKYLLQKQNLAMFIDLSENEKITPVLEASFYEKYQNVFLKSMPISVSDSYYNDNNDTFFDYSASNYVLDILGVKYYAQGDYAKSFLVNNKLTTLEEYPQLDLVNSVEVFYNKRNKNALEEYIIKKSIDKDNFTSYVNHIKGVIYLTSNDFNKALESFTNSNYRAITIPSTVFGYNRIECFECGVESVMNSDYIGELITEQSEMSYKDLSKTLISLEKTSRGKGEKSAKANFLLGNFYYNATQVGYYRQILRFDINNLYGYKYRISYRGKKPSMFEGNNFKEYATYYDNPNGLAQRYLQQANSLSEDAELKAKITFALSKCELLEHNQQLEWSWNINNPKDVFIKDRKYFEELTKYKNTHFFEEVRANCSYFQYYVNNYQ